MPLLPPSLQNTLLNLCILSRLKPNERLSRSVNGVIKVEDPSPIAFLDLACLRRFLTSSGRKQTILDITATLSLASDHVDAVWHSRVCRDAERYPEESAEGRHRLQLLREGLTGAVRGLESLRSTYAEDSTMLAELDMLEVVANALVARITDFCPSPARGSSEQLRDDLDELLRPPQAARPA